MLLVSSEFEKIKNSREYQNSTFKDFETNKKFEEKLKKELETNNVINYITAIARVENFINGKKINEGIDIPIVQLIQKINISENRENLLKWVEESDKKENIKKLITIDREKLRIIEELEKVLKVLESFYNEKIILKEFKEEKNENEIFETENMQYIEEMEKALNSIDKTKLTEIELEKLKKIRTRIDTEYENSSFSKIIDSAGNVIEKTKGLFTDERV